MAGSGPQSGRACVPTRSVGTRSSLAAGRGTAGQAEAQVQAPPPRFALVTNRCTAAAGVADPAAASEDPNRALSRPSGVCGIARQVQSIPVGAPLPNVAMHVEKAQGVRGVRADGASLLAVAVEIGLV